MDTNICVYHITEARTMAFRGNIKLERWNRILKAIDGMTCIAVAELSVKEFLNMSTPDERTMTL